MEHIYELLDGRDLSTIYVFEKLDVKDLKQQALDSELLLEFCRPEDHVENHREGEILARSNATC